MGDAARGAGTHAYHRVLVQPITGLALASSTVYLLWRLSTLGAGTRLLLSVPLLIVEVWSAAQLAALAFQVGRRVESTPDLAAVDHPHGVVVIIDAAGRGIDALERSLVGCRAIRGDHAVRVVDATTRPVISALSKSFGATYVANDNHSVADEIASVGTPFAVWIDAGQIPMPDVLESSLAHFVDTRVAVVQIGLGLLNADSLSHQQRGRDEDALVRDAVGPGLSHRGVAPWFGSGSVVRVAAIESVGGIETGSAGAVPRTAVRLHRGGWRTSFDPRPLIRTMAPDSLDDYLDSHRRRVSDTVSAPPVTGKPAAGERPRS